MILDNVSVVSIGGIDEIFENSKGLGSWCSNLIVIKELIEVEYGIKKIDEVEYKGDLKKIKEFLKDKNCNYLEDKISLVLKNWDVIGLSVIGQK